MAADPIVVKLLVDAGWVRSGALQQYAFDNGEVSIGLSLDDPPGSGFHLLFEAKGGSIEFQLEPGPHLRRVVETIIAAQSKVDGETYRTLVEKLAGLVPVFVKDDDGELARVETG
jgi:hypothetical protein